MITEQDVAPYVVPVRKIAKMLCKRMYAQIPYVDLEQVAWMRLIVEWDRYDPSKSTRLTWVNRMAFRSMIDAIRTGELRTTAVRITRAAYQQGVRTQGEKLEDEYFLLPPPEDKATYWDFIRTATESCGRALSVREREALWFYYGQGLTMTEIGKLLGVCESRVVQIIGGVLDAANRNQAVQYARVGVVVPKRTAKGRNMPLGGRATTQRSGQTS